MKANDLNLAELMDFSHGWVGLHGRRLIIHDLSSLAQFRKDLFEALGMEEAQRLLTRKGFFWDKPMRRRCSVYSNGITLRSG